MKCKGSIVQKARRGKRLRQLRLAEKSSQNLPNHSCKGLARWRRNGASGAKEGTICKKRRIFDGAALNESIYPVVDGKDRGVPIQNALWQPCTGPFNMHVQYVTTCLPKHSLRTCLRNGECSLQFDVIRQLCLIGKWAAHFIPQRKLWHFKDPYTP